MKFKKLYGWLLLLVVLTPLGLLAAGSAWGEWGTEEVGGQVGFVPKGMKALEGLWGSIMPDYNLPGFSGFFLEAVGYIFSAIVGIALIFALFKLVSLFLSDEDPKTVIASERKERSNPK